MRFHGATAKAAALLRGAVTRAAGLEAMPTRTVPVERSILVIGGGIAGLQCASDLAAQGERVYVVEREKQWGGRLRRQSPGQPGHELVRRLVEHLRAYKATLLGETTVTAIGGATGNYEVTLHKGERERSIRVGAVVLATGARLYRPIGEFGYGQFANVLTNAEWERKMAAGKPNGAGKPIRHAAFIQCVGSRQGAAGCSRYCCAVALRQAVALAREGVSVTVFHRDLNVEREDAEQSYREAVQLGVRFVRYDVDAPPVVTGGKRVEGIEMPGSEAEPCDLVILSVGMVPREDPSGGLLDVFRLSGLLQTYGETSGATGLGQTESPALFLCGTVQAPQGIRDTLIHGSAVAAKVAGLMAKGEIAVAPIVASVDALRCRACGLCERICEFGAIRVRPSAGSAATAEVDELLCRGCGACAAHCPSGAVAAGNFAGDQLRDLLRSLLIDAHRRDLEDRVGMVNV